MMKRFWPGPWRRHCTLICLRLLGVAAGGLSAQTNPTTTTTLIRGIQITGNVKVKQITIRHAIHLREGDVFSKKALQEDVDRLWRLGLFEDIQTDIEDVPGGVRVVFRVVERPVVKAIRFEGNREIRTSKLRAKIGLEAGKYLKYYVAKSDLEKIRQAYVEDGFQFAEVKQEFKREKGGVTVVYKISEGPKVYIKRIQFEGNSAFPAKKLLKQMETRPRRFPSLLFPGTFKRQDFESDIIKLRDFYRNQGWLDAIVAWDIRYSEDKTKMFLTIYVEEGQRYHVESVHIRGNRMFTSREIRKRLPFSVGDYFSPEQFDRGAQVIVEMYGEQGFLDAAVDRRASYAEQGPTVAVRYDVKENERSYVEEIKIRGNERTKDNIIRRELTFYPGERVDTKKMRESQDRLIGTGFFDLQAEQPVRMDFERGSSPQMRNVLIDVKEGRTGMVQFAVGYSTNLGVIGDVSYTDTNFDYSDFPKGWHDLVSNGAFHGAGQIFRMRFSPGTRRQEYSLSFQEPSFRDGPYSYGFSGSLYTRLRRDYDEKRLGGTVNLGKRLNKYNVGRLTLGLQNIDIHGIDSDAPKDVFDMEGQHQKAYVELSRTTDHRNNRLFPSKGYKIEESIELATGDVKTIKAMVQGKQYFTVYERRRDRQRHVLSVAATLGAVRSYSGSVPMFERFFAGGGAGLDAASLRGFAFRGVSPVDRIYKKQVGGKLLGLVTVEYDIPIYRRTLHGILFVDAGNVEDRLSDFVKPSNLRASAGFGLRMRLPFLGAGVVALDLGFPMMKESDDEQETFSFNIGGTAPF